MEQNKKIRIAGIALVLCLLFTWLPFFPAAQVKADANDGFELSADGKTLTKYQGSDAVVAIPDGVETIARSAFYNKGHAYHPMGTAV